LPAFDEFLISYKGRLASLPHENHHKAVSNNGIFYPIIVVNGRVTGTWKRIIKKGQARPSLPIQKKYFERPDKAEAGLIDKAEARYLRFVENNPSGRFYFRSAVLVSLPAWRDSYVTVIGPLPSTRNWCSILPKPGTDVNWSSGLYFL